MDTIFLEDKGAFYAIEGIKTEYVDDVLICTFTPVKAGKFTLRGNLNVWVENMNHGYPVEFHKRLIINRQ